MSTFSSISSSSSTFASLASTWSSSSSSSTLSLQPPPAYSLSAYPSKPKHYDDFGSLVAPVYTSSSSPSSSSLDSLANARDTSIPLGPVHTTQTARLKLTHAHLFEIDNWKWFKIITSKAFRAEEKERTRRDARLTEEDEVLICRWWYHHQDKMVL